MISQDGEDLDEHRLVSQSDLAGYIRRTFPHEAARALEPLSVSHLLKQTPQRRIVTINQGVTAQSAFKALFLNGTLSAAPIVVPRTGELVDQVSLSDLAWGTALLTDLLRPVGPFLKCVRENRDRRVASGGVAVCDRADDVHAVFVKLVEGRLHRVWVVEDEDEESGSGKKGKHVRGCVSLTDIFDAISKSSS
ncbi:MAG: hypothetical protein SGCHY_004109 [Lobulomycetales sp.]